MSEEMSKMSAEEQELVESICLNLERMLARENKISVKEWTNLAYDNGRIVGAFITDKGEKKMITLKIDSDEYLLGNIIL